MARLAVNVFSWVLSEHRINPWHLTWCFIYIHCNMTTLSLYAIRCYEVVHILCFQPGQNLRVQGFGAGHYQRIALYEILHGAQRLAFVVADDAAGFEDNNRGS